MNNITKHIFFVLAYVALFATNVFAQVRVFAQVDPKKDIYVGESFTFYIIIDGQSQPGQADMTPLAKYNPRAAGSQDLSQSSISIINGKTTRSEVKRFVMSYSLTSNQPGPIELSPVNVTVGGRTYSTNPVSVNILKPGTTDQLDLEVTLSEQQCYIGQPVLMTIKFYFSADIRDPRFDIPVFNSDAFYFENPDIHDPQAKEFDLGSGTTVMVSQYQVSNKGKQTNLIVMRKILIPKFSGPVKLSPATASTDVVVGRARSRNRFFGSQNQYKRFMVTSNPLQLNVSPLPQQGKPDGFYGLVGNYTISASAQPTTDVYMGDPITLTIKVGGSKYLKPVRWPALENISEWTANFKIHTQKASPTIANGFKVFTQTIRPDNNQANVIPSVPLVFFDPDTASYSVARTKPIKLDLKPSKRLTTADIEGKDFVTVNKEVEAVKKGLSANYEGPDVLKNMSFEPISALFKPRYLPVWAVPLAILILSLAAKLLTHTSPEIVTAKLRRKAYGKAVGQLKKITSIDSTQHDELVASIMKQYIGDRFNKMAGSLTPDDCYDIISIATESNEIAGKFRQTIEHCQAARYASVDINIDAEEISDIIELIRNIEKKSRK